jgi:hypothetical protein
LESEWKKAVHRFVLNNLGQMEQEEFDAWLDGDLELAPLLAPFLRTQKQHRDAILRELYQISPSEIYDRFRAEHPELVFGDSQKVIVRIGKELEGMKEVLRSV